MAVTRLYRQVNRACPREVAIEFDRTRRAYLPNTTTEEAVQGGLLNEVIGTMSRELLFRAENQNLGLTVTRAMQRDAVANEPSFQDELGQFSEGRFMQALANAGYSESDYLKRVDNVLQRQQLMAPLAGGLRYSNELASVVAAHELEKRTVKLTSYAVRPESVPTPDDAVIDKFFRITNPAMTHRVCVAPLLAAYPPRPLPKPSPSVIPRSKPLLMNVLMNSERLKPATSARWYLTMKPLPQPRVTG